MENTLPLFKTYSELENIPRIPLGKLPSLVERLQSLERTFGTGEIWVKRDDLLHDTYGGNKVRKLEFILADAKRRRVKTLITAGGIGSNHALALTVHSRAVGFKPVLVLFGQPVTRHVRENLLLNSYFGAEMRYADSYLKLPFMVAGEFLKRLTSGSRLLYVPAGGTSPLGTLGYVNAAFELREQIERSEMPKPDCIFVPAGTGGTMAGLVLGSALSGLDTRVIGVRVTPKFIVNRFRVFWLMNETLNLMKKHVPNLPHPEVSLSDITLITDYLGKGYGYATEKSEEAVKAAAEAGLRLEETYTGKTFAAFLDFVKPQGSGVFLFWNTFNSVNHDEVIKGVDHRSLPQEFHKLFAFPFDR